MLTQGSICNLLIYRGGMNVVALVRRIGAQLDLVRLVASTVGASDRFPAQLEQGNSGDGKQQPRDKKPQWAVSLRQPVPHPSLLVPSTLTGLTDLLAA
eukprot:766399-Hanusia_phi.AAC.1